MRDYFIAAVMAWAIISFQHHHRDVEAPAAGPHIESVR